jgi:hypothetical protein
VPAPFVSLRLGKVPVSGIPLYDFTAAVMIRIRAGIATIPSVIIPGRFLTPREDRKVKRIPNVKREI